MSTKFSAKSPLDLIAFAPVALGFTPDESVVMLTFGGAGFHARVDLPVGGGYDEVTDALLTPCTQHGTESVVFVIYTQHTDAATALFASFRDAFFDAGIRLVDYLVVRGDRFMSLTTHESGSADVSLHPFTVQAIADGRVTRTNRDDLRNDIAMRDTIAEPAPIDDEVTHGDLVSAHIALVDLLDPNARLDDEQLGFYLAALDVESLRDTVVKFVARHGRSNPGLRAVLADAAARAPYGFRRHALAVYAFAAYMNGNGASAWIAVDECNSIGKTNLSDIVSELLTQAVNPANAAAIFED